MTTLLRGRQIVTPDDVLADGWILVDGPRLQQVGSGEPPAAAEVVDLSEHTLVPGFVDAHCHGGGGHSHTDGDPAAAAAAAALHLRHGTTRAVASLITASLDDLTRSIRDLAGLVEDGLLAGLHLEGPWLSPEHVGAHDMALLRAPAAHDVDRLLEAGRGTVRMVTLAPELEGGIDAVRRVVGAGAVAALGHTDATYDVARSALRVGATAGTHLFNAMRPLHHREPGAALALLEDATAYVELVPDGVHLHPAVLRMAARAAARTVLVTDAMAAAGAADGDYRLGGLDVHVRDGRARLATTGAIAGSTLTLDAALRYAVAVAGLPLVAAVDAVSRAPAEMLGLPDVGVLRPGGRADVVALDAHLEVTAVMKDGRWVAGQRETPR